MCALCAAKSNLINIMLIYQENPAGVRPAGSVNKAAPLYFVNRGGM